MAPRRPKVFCIGFPNTGTTSLRAALKELGYKVQGPFGLDQPLEALETLGEEMALELAKKADAVAGEPWPLFYHALDRRFPGSRFILTTRDAERWAETLAGLWRAPNTAMMSFFVGAEHVGAEHQEAWRTVFAAHDAAVREHFADRPDDLLVMSADEPMLWGPLCTFLRVETPATPFPEMRMKGDPANWLHRARRGLAKLTDRLDPYVAP
ncbi:MAG: sulfotransferase [Pseudomonadota bacterium]